VNLFPENFLLGRPGARCLEGMVVNVKKERETGEKHSKRRAPSIVVIFAMTIYRVSQAHQPPQGNRCHVWAKRKSLVTQQNHNQQPLRGLFLHSKQDKNKPVAPSNQRPGLKNE